MRIMNVRKISIIFLGLTLFLAVTGCKKKVAAPPPPPPVVFEAVAGALLRLFEQAEGVVEQIQHQDQGW